MFFCQSIHPQCCFASYFAFHSVVVNFEFLSVDTILKCIVNSAFCGTVYRDVEGDLNLKFVNES